MSKPLDFGVQSYCFRAFNDNVEVAKKVLEIGVKKIEICGCHGDFHKPSSLKDVVKIYQDAGISIVSLGVETLVGNANERDIFESASIAGAKHISVHFRVDSFPQAIQQAQKLSDEFGIRLGIHCHGGYMFGGQMDVLDHLIKLGSPQVGVCIDTAWCMQTGPSGDPVEWAKRYAGKVYGLHYKDFIFDKHAQWQDTVVGEGTLKLPAFIAALEASNFDGMAVIEYEGDVDNPVPALKNCVSAMRKSA
jgi:sugar phosphate isomerase/epimerase